MSYTYFVVGLPGDGTLPTRASFGPGLPALGDLERVRAVLDAWRPALTWQPGVNPGAWHAHGPGHDCELTVVLDADGAVTAVSASRVTRAEVEHLAAALGGWAFDPQQGEVILASPG